MKRQAKRNLNKLPFWKRWMLWGAFLLLLILTLFFLTMMLSIPMMYETEAQSGIIYGVGMALLLTLVCADSARRVYRKLRPKQS